MSNHTTRNATTLSHDAKDLWKSPRGTAIRIEVLVVLAVVVFLFLAASGYIRRRHKLNWFFQKVVLGAYILSFSLATYTLGSMQSSTVKSTMYPIWAISLFILHGCTDSITAYSLDDNTQDTRLVYQAFMYNGYTTFLLITVSSGLYRYPATVLYLSSIGYHKFMHRQAAHQLASRSWNMNKMVADYMYDERKKEFDPTTMEGCHYLVDWPLSKSKLVGPSSATQLTADAEKIIDIDKVWRWCNNRSLGPEPKDTCLSFSLFHLLRMRTFGFAFGESKKMAHDFVFSGLLSDCNRVFKVIEVELAFMYDFFFTKYAAFYYRSRAATVWALVSFAFISVTIYSVWDESVALGATTTDALLTLLILVITALIELLQVVLYWTSIWARVSFVCQHLRNQAIPNRRRIRCMMRLKEILIKIGVCCASNEHYWKHKLEQFSLLDSVSYNPNRNASKESARINRVRSWSRIHWLIDPMSLDRLPYLVKKIRQRPGKPIKLTTEVKKALINSLKCTKDGTLTNGKSSLRINKAEQLLWTCERDISSDSSCYQRNENQTHLILTWHIATCYCEMSTPCPHEGPELKLHVEVATKLSKYCAHLVVSAPKFLPGHHYDTTCVFDEVAEEAAEFLENSTDKYVKMRDSESPPDTIFKKGMKLGKELEGIQDLSQRWKVMADFWAEMMLYVSPSDNVTEHMEQLAKGGEFITHLWALLYHAGILERDQKNHSHPNAESTQNSTRHQAAPHEENSATHEDAASQDHPEQMSNSLQLDPLPPRWMRKATEFLFMTRSWNVFNSAARHVMLVPISRMGSFSLQAPSPPGVQALGMTTANEHRIDVHEALSSTQQALPEEATVPAVLCLFQDH